MHTFLQQFEGGRGTATALFCGDNFIISFIDCNNCILKFELCAHDFLFFLNCYMFEWFCNLHFFLTVWHLGILAGSARCCNHWYYTGPYTQGEYRFKKHVVFNWVLF
jgi:hypothetical protein